MFLKLVPFSLTTLTFWTNDDEVFPYCELLSFIFLYFIRLYDNIIVHSKEKLHDILLIHD